MSNTKTVYRHDSEGYYIGTSLAQYVGDDLLLPSDCVEAQPTIKNGYWAKYNGKKWVNEKIPVTCDEAIEKGLTCISNGPGKHNQEVKLVLESLVASDSDNYRVVVSDGFVMSIEEIPEPTEEEIALEEEQAKQAAAQAAIDQLIKEMATADLMGDEEWKAELRSEYAALMEEE